MACVEDDDDLAIKAAPAVHYRSLVASSRASFELKTPSIAGKYAVAREACISDEPPFFDLDT
jgi:hypothetical protein